MSDLLPPNSTALERALATVGAAATDLPVLIRELWDPEACPLELLPWLAWAWSVDEWDDAWSEQQKRETVRQALPVQRIKGTIGAVKRALAALGFPVQLQEWFNQSPAGAPYTFRAFVEADQVPATQADLLKALRIIAATKNLRSHLESIQVQARSQTVLHVGAATLTGHDLTVTGFRSAPVLINELALNLGAQPVLINEFGLNLGA